MIRKTGLLLTALFGLSGLSAMAAESRTGMQELAIADATGDRPLAGFVWYPTQGEGEEVLALGNAVWKPVPVVPDAPLTATPSPLVVLSHGMFGNARNQAWLAKALTQRGYIVAAIDHPGTSTFSRDPDHQRELWQRPKDVSRVIDFLSAHESFGPLIDKDRIYMAGHSLGGFTAVALAGGRFAPERVDANCAAGRDPLICEIFGVWNVAKTQEDRLAMSADMSDPRIKAFAVFDLGGTQTFSPESLASLQTPMQIWGAPVDLHGLDLDLESRALMAAVPQGRAQYLEPETLAHFDFLGECTQKGLAVLKEEEPEDAFVCIDGTEARRAEHQMIAEQVEAFFSKH